MSYKTVGIIYCHGTMVQFTSWHCSVVVITSAQLYSPRPKFKFYAVLNPARGVLEIRNGENLWQWPLLEVRLNAFCRSTKQQKQVIIIIFIMAVPLVWWKYLPQENTVFILKISNIKCFRTLVAIRWLFLWFKQYSHTLASCIFLMINIWI